MIIRRSVIVRLFIGACVGDEDVNIFITVAKAMFLNEEVGCSCLIGRFEYEPREGICAQRMPRPGGQE
jgi:hypothetical protein